MARNTLPAIRFTQKAQLIEALEARRPWAEQYDAKRLAAHQKAEKDAMRQVRDRCKAVARMTYEELCAEDGYRLVKFDRPDCPTSAVDSLDEILRTITVSHQESFTISADDYRTARIHHLLTHDENARAVMC